MVQLVIFVNLFFIPLLPLYLIYSTNQKPLEPGLDLLFQYGIITVCNIPLTKVFIFAIKKAGGIFVSIDSGYYTVAALLPTLFAVLLYKIYPDCKLWKGKVVQKGIEWITEKPYSSTYMRLESQRQRISGQAVHPKDLLKAFEVRMNLCNKVEKRWFWGTFVLLILYVEFVFFARNTALGYISVPLLNALQAVVVIPFCFLCLLMVSKWKISGEGLKYRAKFHRQLLLAAMVWALTFSIFILYQRAYWPGAFSQDSFSQYEQAYSGSYNNWHPVLHTWLFFWLPLQLFHSPSGIVSLQVLWFSLAVTYLFYVLYSNGCSRAFLVCGWLYIVANPNTLSIMMFPWKDSAMTIFSTVVFAQLVQIYITKGLWLKRWYNLVSFSIFAFLTLEMRHNAMLLMIPIFVLMICCFKAVRKKVFISVFMVSCGHLLLYGPVFSFMHVQLPGNRVVETMGLPMTVLSDIYMQDREALNEDARSFMDSLATQEVWGAYRLGDFNSVKFYTDVSPIEEAGYKKLLEYTVDAAEERPDLAWRAFCLLTHLVWEVESGSGWGDSPFIVSNSHGIYYQGNETLRNMFSTYAALISSHLTRYLFRYSGVIILLLLFLAVANIGNGNLCRVLFVLAPLAYNFGTMLLLTGSDFRFFHFNFVIAVPLIYLMLRSKDTLDDNENQTFITQ